MIMAEDHRSSNGQFRKRHGLCDSRIYQIWESMKARCDRPTCNGYKHYGGKGVSYCEDWVLFDNFNRDMAGSYEDHLTLDRLDILKDYSKDNCKWSTTGEQARNRSDNQMVTIEGVCLCLMDWKLYFGLTNSIVYKRNLRGEKGYHLIRPSRVAIKKGSDYGLREKVLLLKNNKHFQ